ncbi:hypothetical protein [Desulfobacca acetoxidans]
MNWWEELFKVFFQVDNFWGQNIVYLILLLFLLGVSLTLYNFFYSLRQRWYLNKVRTRFTDIAKEYSWVRGEGDKSKKIKGEETRQSQKWIEERLEQGKNELIGGIPAKSIIAQRVENLFQVRYVGHLTYETLKEVLFTTELERTGLTRYLTGIFILLGLAGTVLGLSQSVIHMQPVLTKLNNVADLNAVCLSISKTLAGMRTAFSATIAGLLATVFLSFCNFIYGQFATRFVTELEDFTNIHLIPYFLVPTTEEAAIKFADTMSKSAQALNNSANPLATVSERLDTSTKTIENFSQTMARLGDKYDTAISKLAEVQQELLQQQKEARAESANSIKKLEKTLEAFQQQATQLVASHDGALRQVSETLVTETKEYIRTMAQENKSHIQTLTKEQQTALEALVEGNKVMLTEVKNHLESQTKEHQTALTSLIQANTDSFKDLEKQHVKNVEGISEKIQKTVEHAMQKHTTVIDSLFKDKVNDFQEVINHQRKVVEDQGKVVENYKAILSMEKKKIEEVTKIYDLSTIMLDRSHYEKMMSREDKLLAGMESLQRQFRELLADLCIRVEKLSTSDGDGVGQKSEPPRGEREGIQ